jgi:acyl-coenzyme A synthetase/AMP-(fatty) acid ligase
VTYLSQLILFALALLSALYKRIKEDELGKPKANRIGMRLPTKAGAVIIILSTLSFLFAISTKWNATREQENQSRAAKASQQLLMDQLGESNQKSDNNALWSR